MSALLLAAACLGSAIGGAHIGWKVRRMWSRDIARRRHWCGECDRPYPELVMPKERAS